jgi:hypothetical protein
MHHRWIQTELSDHELVYGHKTTFEATVNSYFTETATTQPIANVGDVGELPPTASSAINIFLRNTTMSVGHWGFPRLCSC